MLTAEEMIQLIRSTVHDKQELEYSNENIISVINSGIRFIRRQIQTLRPQMLIEEPICGILKAGSASIDLPVVPTKIIDLYIDGQRINAVNFLNIEKPYRQGAQIENYYITGIKTMNFYPVINHDVNYIIRVVGSANRLEELTDQSPFSDDMDDFLIEYVCIRLSLTNEFDMSQEAQLLSILIDQIRENVLTIEEPHLAIDGYFNSPNGGVKGY